MKEIGEIKLREFFINMGISYNEEPIAQGGKKQKKGLLTNPLLLGLYY